MNILKLKSARSKETMLRRLYNFLIGAAVCSLGDAAHVYKNIDAYPPVYKMIPFLNIPWWVPFLFGFSCLATGLGIKIFNPLFKYKAVRPITPKCTALAGLVFFALYLSSAFLPLTTPGTMDVFLALSAILFWKYFDRSLQGLLFAFLTALTGTLVEIFLVHSGVFFYNDPYTHLMGVPSWLPWLYIPAAIAAGHLERTYINK